MPRIPGLLERIQQPLYDRGQVATSGTNQLVFFQTPQGAADNAGNVKTLVSTNMDQGASLPYPKNFEVHAIRKVTQYGASVSDLNAIENNAWFRFFIGTKDYLVMPSFMLTQGVGLDGVAAGSTNVVSVHNGRPDQRGIYVLAEAIDLIAQQNFRAEINFAITQTLGATVLITIVLDGFLKREVH